MLTPFQRSAIVSGLVFLILLYLSGCKPKKWKICNDQCIMRGSDAGVQFDEPCGDVIALKAMQNKDPDYGLQDLITDYGVGGVLVPQSKIATSIPIHDPIFPMVAGGASEDIRFSLTPAGGAVVERATLYILKVSSDVDDLFEIDDRYTFPVIEPGAPGVITVNFCNEAGTGYERTVNDIRTFVPTIYYTTSFAGLGFPLEEKITFIKYRFVVKYAGDPDIETMEVSFALQDFHGSTRMEKYPAPVYAQGDSEHLIDVLFVPARDHGQNQALTTETLDYFRASCGSLIHDSFYKDPHLRFWRQEFNFWINKQEGIAADLQQCHDDCSHTLPENYEVYVAAEAIELIALLHKGRQHDFTHPVDPIFSSQMGENCGDRAFLHELGHAAFDLSDEYLSGANVQSGELPNNWESKGAAEQDAVFRHKQVEDVKKIK